VLKKQQQQQQQPQDASDPTTVTTPHHHQQQRHERSRRRKVTQQFEDSLPMFLELAWAINVRDITQTLNKVCYKLFRDEAETL
jgi:hypothetical protein